MTGCLPIVDLCIGTKHLKLPLWLPNPKSLITFHLQPPRKTVSHVVLAWNPSYKYSLVDYADLAIIDLSKASTPEGRAQLANEVRDAMRDNGFFYVINHGYTQEQVIQFLHSSLTSAFSYLIFRPLESSTLLTSHSLTSVMRRSANTKERCFNPGRTKGTNSVVTGYSFSSLNSKPIWASLLTPI